MCSTALNKENQFLYYLTQTSNGNVKNITIETMIELIRYINSECISELQFIENEYLTSVFSDQQLANIMPLGSFKV